MNAAAMPLHEEVVRMQQVPGIYFATEAARREAKVMGTGLGVWEVVRLLRAFGGDIGRLLEAYPHLSMQGVKAAVRYAALYPREIEAAIRQAEELSNPEALRRRYPELAPHVIDDA